MLKPSPCPQCGEADGTFIVGSGVHFPTYRMHCENCSFWGPASSSSDWTEGAHDQAMECAVKLWNCIRAENYTLPGRLRIEARNHPSFAGILQEAAEHVANMRLKVEVVDAENDRLREAVRAARPYIEEGFKGYGDPDREGAVLKLIDAALVMSPVV